MAGIIGMTDEGPKCGVGIAPNCIIGSKLVSNTSSLISLLEFEVLLYDEMYSNSFDGYLLQI